jgi:hypothetical protein
MRMSWLLVLRMGMEGRRGVREMKRGMRGKMRTTTLKKSKPPFHNQQETHRSAVHCLSYR